MAAINDLISQIEDKELRERIEKELNKYAKQKKFGLVFEEHLPECVPLYNMPIRKGCKVALKTGKVNEYYSVLQVEGDNVYCTDKKENQFINFLKKDIVCVAEFGEPIYPYLKQIDCIYKSDDKDLPTHALIQADNYHALQLLEYLYAGKVDCIYIDPPYNTGARDWKYNNDYVDANDTYRHSKWLSMMKKRLLLAKKLLNPTDSVMIVTIDEKEYLHLGCLLEELFPEARIQMISSVINPKGSSRKEEFSRVEEFLFFVMFGNAQPFDSNDNMLDDETELSENESKKGTIWLPLRRTGTNSNRIDRPRLFYPICVDSVTGKIIGCKEFLSADIHISEENIIDKANPSIILVYPIKPKDGSEGRWQLQGTTVMSGVAEGSVKAEYNEKKKKWIIKYLNEGAKKEIESGELKVLGKDKNGTLMIERTSNKQVSPKTVWNRKLHNATTFGTNLITQILETGRFSFPKSLYAVHDAIRFFVANKPTALIVDFFAGSGTTLHAVNLLNAEDGGKRQCIMVTNNEVSDDEAKLLTSKGYAPGDNEWEKLGIARHVNWPRTKCSIIGVDIKGMPIDGEYLTTNKQNIEVDRKIIQIAMDGDSMTIDSKKSILYLIGKIPQNILSKNTNYILDEDYPISILFNMDFANEWLEILEESQVEEIYIVTDKKTVFKQLKNKIKEVLGKIVKEEAVKFPMSDGFEANAVFFELGFLDNTSVQLGRQFKELLPLLWLKSGGFGKCPETDIVLKDKILPPYIVLQENRFAVLIDENYFSEFVREVNELNEIKTVFIVTDFEKGFKSMANELKAEKSYQLYRDYLDNFRINIER